MSVPIDEYGNNPVENTGGGGLSTINAIPPLSFDTPSQTLSIGSASQTAEGIINISSQSLKGKKTFIDGASSSTYPTLSSDLATVGFVNDRISHLNWLEPVIDFYDISTGYPTEILNARYISIGTFLTWSNNNIYTWDGNSWAETVIIEGDTTYNLTQNITYIFITSWQRWGLTVNHLDLLNIGTNSHAQIDLCLSASSSHISNNTSAHFGQNLQTSGNVIFNTVDLLNGLTIRSSTFLMRYNNDISSNAIFQCLSNNNLQLATSGSFILTNTTQSTSSSTGALVVTGGIGCGDSLHVNGQIHGLVTDDSSSFSTGSLITAGGLACSKKAYFGGNDTYFCYNQNPAIHGRINISPSGVMTFYSTGSQISWFPAQFVSIQNTTESTNQSNGAFVVSGGVGIAKSLSIGNTFRITNQYGNLLMDVGGVSPNNLLIESGAVLFNSSGNKLYFDNIEELLLINTLTSSLDRSASLFTRGGIHISKDINIRGKLNPITSSNYIYCHIYATAGTKPDITFNFTCSNNTSTTLLLLSDGLGGYTFSSSEVNNLSDFSTSPHIIVASNTNTVNYTGLTLTPVNTFTLNASEILYQQFSSSFLSVYFHYLFLNGFYNLSKLNKLIKISIYQNTSLECVTDINLCTLTWTTQGYLNSSLTTSNNTISLPWNLILIPNTQYTLAISCDKNINLGYVTDTSSVIGGTVSDMYINNTLSANFLCFQLSGAGNVLNGTLGVHILCKKPTDTEMYYSYTSSLDSQYFPFIDTLSENVFGNLLYDSHAPTISSSSYNSQFLLTNTIDSVTTTSGSLILSGGVAIQKNLNIAGSSKIYSTTISTSQSTGSLIVSGGVGISGNLNISNTLKLWDGTSSSLITCTAGTLKFDSSSQVSQFASTDQVQILSTTSSSDSVTGALIISGGVGIVEKLNIGGSMKCGLSTSTSSTNTTSGSLIVNGGVGISENVNIGGTLKFSSGTPLSIYSYSAFNLTMRSGNVANDITLTTRATRIGNNVHISFISNGSVNGNAMTFYQSTSTIPSDFIPSYTSENNVTITNNNTTAIMGGYMKIDTTGSVYVYRNNTLQNFQNGITNLGNLGTNLTSVTLEICFNLF